MGHGCIGQAKAVAVAIVVQAINTDSWEEMLSATRVGDSVSSLRNCETDGGYNVPHILALPHLFLQEHNQHRRTAHVDMKLVTKHERHWAGLVLEAWLLCSCEFINAQSMNRMESGANSRTSKRNGSC